MRFYHSLLLGILVYPAPVFANPIRDAYLQQIESAIAGGRLVQAGQMLDQASDRPTDDQFHLFLVKADLLLAKGTTVEAYKIYAMLADQQPTNVRAVTGAGLAALHLRHNEEAYKWLIHATSMQDAGWRAWNGLGIIGDFQRNWQLSETAYKKAVALSPSNAAIWNNMGYSYLSQRRYDEAVSALKRAADMAPDVEKIRLNLDIAYAFTGHYPRQRRAGETIRQWAARLNNAGCAALIAGDSASARSLFAQAIAASDIRFPRAEANLRMAGGVQ